MLSNISDASIYGKFYIVANIILLVYPFSLKSLSIFSQFLTSLNKFTSLPSNEAPFVFLAIYLLEHPNSVVLNLLLIIHGCTAVFNVIQLFIIGWMYAGTTLISFYIVFSIFIIIFKGFISFVFILSSFFFVLLSFPVVIVSLGLVAKQELSNPGIVAFPSYE